MTETKKITTTYQFIGPDSTLIESKTFLPTNSETEPEWGDEYLDQAVAHAIAMVESGRFDYVEIYDPDNSMTRATTQSGRYHFYSAPGLTDDYNNYEKAQTQFYAGQFQLIDIKDFVEVQIWTVDDWYEPCLDPAFGNWSCLDYACSYAGYLAEHRRETVVVADPEDPHNPVLDIVEPPDPKNTLQYIRLYDPAKP